MWCYQFLFWYFSFLVFIFEGENPIVGGMYSAIA